MSGRHDLCHWCNAAVVPTNRFGFTATALEARCKPGSVGELRGKWGALARTSLEPPLSNLPASTPIINHSPFQVPYRWCWQQRTIALESRARRSVGRRRTHGMCDSNATPTRHFALLLGFPTIAAVPGPRKTALSRCVQSSLLPRCCDSAMEEFRQGLTHQSIPSWHRS